MSSPAHLPGQQHLPPPAALPEGTRDVWARLAPLVPPGRLTPATADLFAMLCTQITTFWEADQLVQETGLLTADALTIGVNPALAIRDHADTMTARWAKAFGLMPDTPATPAPYSNPRPRRLRD